MLPVTQVAHNVIVNRLSNCVGSRCWLLQHHSGDEVNPAAIIISGTCQPMTVTGRCFQFQVKPLAMPSFAGQKDISTSSDFKPPHPVTGSRHPYSIITAR